MALAVADRSIARNRCQNVKYYNPKNMKPSSSEFYRLTKDQLSETARQSLSYRATASLLVASPIDTKQVTDATLDRELAA